MLHFNRYQVQLNNFDANSVQYENSGEYTTENSFAQHHAEDSRSIIFDETNSFNNQNGYIQDWLKNCEILGFIPDRPTSDYPVSQSYCNYPLDYHYRRTYARSPYKCHSSKSTQNTLRVNLKRKRRRTTFTTEQIVLLEGVFNRKPYITREERIAMMNRLQLSEKAIKIWFQNRRRMSDKRCQEYAPDSPSSADIQDSFSERLALIETQIKENTDDNGYVTLNDQVMSELVSVIDDYLSKDVDLCESQPMLSSKTPEDVVMYEPISPASSDYNLI